MNKVWRALRQAWWLVVGLGAAVVGVVALVVFSRPGKASEATQRPGQVSGKPLRERAQEEVERVRLEGELEKAQRKAYAQVQRAELRRIEERGKKDPVLARRQLATWLRENL